MKTILSAIALLACSSAVLGGHILVSPEIGPFDVSRDIPAPSTVAMIILGSMGLIGFSRRR